jgi:hypothetical protein
MSGKVRQGDPEKYGRADEKLRNGRGGLAGPGVAAQ